MRREDTEHGSGGGTTPPLADCRACRHRHACRRPARRAGAAWLGQTTAARGPRGRWRRMAAAATVATRLSSPRAAAHAVSAGAALRPVEGREQPRSERIIQGQRAPRGGAHYCARILPNGNVTAPDRFRSAAGRNLGRPLVPPGEIGPRQNPSGCVRETGKPPRLPVPVGRTATHNPLSEAQPHTRELPQDLNGREGGVHGRGRLKNTRESGTHFQQRALSGSSLDVGKHNIRVDDARRRGNRSHPPRHRTETGSSP